MLKDWGILSINGECLISEVFHGLSTGQIESADGFRLPDEFADSPVSIKVLDAVEFGKYFKFLLVKAFLQLLLFIAHCPCKRNLKYFPNSTAPSTFIDSKVGVSHKLNIAR